jgi:hypothetical protein
LSFFFLSKPSSSPFDSYSKFFEATYGNEKNSTGRFAGTFRPKTTRG